MIVLRPVGGLCNRMLAIASAINLSKDSKRPLKIIWERDPMLNCRFDELFLPLENNIEIIETRTKQRLHERICRRMTHFKFSKIFYMNTLSENNISVEDLANYKKVLIYGANRFYRLENLSTLFKPQSDINKKIEYQNKLMSEGTIGLHLRRTDHRRSIKRSPTILFLNKIQSYLNSESKTMFFLATDSPEEEEKILKMFPSNIMTYPKETLNRNDAIGIKDALVDLMCLANCKKIYGSYYSSFSFTAAEVGEIELSVLKNSTLFLSK